MPSSQPLTRDHRPFTMSVAVPYAPRDRGIRPYQLLEDLHGFHGREIEPAISCGEKDAKKSRVSLFSREIFR